MKEQQITIVGDDGQEIIFFVVEQTTISGKNYLLVADSDDEEAQAYIMMEVCDEDGQSVYEFVEDEKELDALSKVFVELLEDVSIKVQD